MKALLRRVPRAFSLLVLGVTLPGLNAQWITHYLGNPFTSTFDNLVTGHHLEGVAEFAAIGDLHPLSLDLRVVDAVGSVLLEVSFNEPGFTGGARFWWTAGEIAMWDVTLERPGALPSRTDYIYTLYFFDPAFGWHEYDQAADEYGSAAGVVWEGFAETIGAAGTWSPVPEPQGLVFASALALLGATVVRRATRRG